ncbi:isopeptide-forming domain-containing fimbrial protein [Catenibacterium mitsuokai]|uniref:isopeptide-forming domain-containing fimbrial protein n=1 Tax=Catenibacterium mitsuokai TaxID=100886 RepID=UPI002E777DCD|nr:isopeptide-forming domain-containing fimbrial protein [Catenibacterium mitsuokai]
MKLFKKLASFILAFAMVMAIAMPSVVMAADGKSTITIDGATAGSEYVAYKLFDATDDGNGHFSYTVNSKYEAVLKEVTGKTSGAEIVKYLNGIKDNAAAVREFADKVYAKVKDMAVDYTATNGKFVNVDQGYYLIAQTQTGTNEAYSLVMLGTAGKNALTVTPKTGVPTFEKKIKEKNDSTGVESDWQDASDYDIGDKVPFKLTGTVSDKYDNYKTYYYAFHDKMDDTLQFNADSVVVKIDGVVVDKSKYTLNTTTSDGCTFEVVFNDLKTVSPTKPGKVTVEYTATLKENAKLGSEGNFNKGKLEFNNNPYYEGEGKPEKTGETPWDEVVVFTYKLIANKTDGQGQPLAGAGFTLYKFNKDTNDYVEVKKIEAGETTTFEFTGADAGKYKLVETTVPDGYNKADDLVFEVKGTYEAVNNDDPLKAPRLTKLEIFDENGNSITGEGKVFTTNLAAGTATTNIKNLTGSELPSTGGMGTTVLYAAGTLMILAAAAFLVMKKKAESK